MEKQINFEQLMEEICAGNPSAEQIWGTENPLEIWMGAERMDLRDHLANHLPLWISVAPEKIPADGESASVVTIHSPKRANQTVRLVIRHGSAEQIEEVALDKDGNGIIEIASETAGEIHLTVESVLVRNILTVIE